MAPTQQAKSISAFRSIAFNLAWALWTGLFAFAIPLLLVVHDRPRRVRILTRLWARGFLSLSSFWLGISFVVRGRENVPKVPHIILCNHQSVWETIAALVLFPNVAIVAKAELLKVPVLGWYLRQSPMILIDRELNVQAFRRMSVQGQAAIRDGRTVLVFPQGTRTPSGEPIRFRRGAEFMLRSLRVPVLPVVVNSGCYWAKAPARAGVITISVLPPLDAALAPNVLARTAAELMERERGLIGG